MAAAGAAGREGECLPGRRLPRKWVTLAVPLIPGIAAIAVNGYQLGRPSLWRDEAYTVDAAQRSLPQILRMLRHTDAVNGLYYAVMHPVLTALGTSATALRLPSVLALAVAAAFTALTGCRLAGLLLAVEPQATRYAQEARSYTIVMMFAAAATWLLLRALERDHRAWWAGYAAALALMGLFNLLALLLAAAHAVTMLVARARSGAGLRRWLGAVAAGSAALSPMIVLAASQRGQVSWLKPPGWPAIGRMTGSFAGSRALLPVIGVLVAAGVAGSLAQGRGVPADTATVALPWLGLPPVTLLTLSQFHPLYNFRYVLFCLPAVCLLAAAGMAWLASLATRATCLRASRRMAWIPATGLLAVFAVLVAAPQQSVRMPGSRPDNLRKAAQVIAEYERPGDAVIYFPARWRAVSMAYPGPYHRLRDLALAESPVAAGNLAGIEVPAAAVRRRLAHLDRVWVISGRGGAGAVARQGDHGHVRAGLPWSYHLLRRWRAGATLVALFARG